MEIYVAACCLVALTLSISVGTLESVRGALSILYEYEYAVAKPVDWRLICLFISIILQDRR